MLCALSPQFQRKTEGLNTKFSKKRWDLHSPIPHR